MTYDPHRFNPRVHYRLYNHPDGPCVICVQDFDYPDYDEDRFMTPDAYDWKDDAEKALRRLTDPWFADDEVTEARQAAFDEVFDFLISEATRDRLIYTSTVLASYPVPANLTEWLREKRVQIHA
jgi:hypothetical protein